MAPAPLPRRTLAQPATLSGTTLFTGAHASITIHPSWQPRGIVFRRVDLPDHTHTAIPATATHVVPESRRTVLSSKPGDKHAPTVQTVEHLMSALAGLGVTDAVVDLAGPEIPIADGSAAPFVHILQGAGIVPLATPAPHTPPILVRDPIVLDDGKSRIDAQPTDRPGLELVYNLEYPPGAHIAPQQASLFVPLGQPAEHYADRVAPARTFCLAQEAQAMRHAGLFAHLSPKDMLVIGEHGPIDNAYRFDHEPARHKLLDLLGDIALAGRPIQARITATRTGHAHNHAMARALMNLDSAANEMGL